MDTAIRYHGRSVRAESETARGWNRNTGLEPSSKRRKGYASENEGQRGTGKSYKGIDTVIASHSDLADVAHTPKQVVRIKG